MDLDLLHPRHLYRPNVGLCLTNGEGLVLAGERQFVDPHYSGHGRWQMPQGGIDEGESLMDAAYRELWEETTFTADQVTLVHIHPQWITYNWPPEINDSHTSTKGQQQRFLLFKYTGDLPDVAALPHPEFREFGWRSPEWLQKECVAFRTHVYKAVFDDFKAFL